MRFFYKSHLGLTRDNNEDCILAMPPKLFAVADGMGGYNAGEVASREALSKFRDTIEVSLQEGNEIVYSLRKGISVANSHIFDMGRDNDVPIKMGTTLTALYIESSSKAHVVQVGDSRLYRYRSGKLLQVTKDQTLVGELLAAGKISEDEAKVHPRKNLLLQGIGVEQIVQPEIVRIDLLPKDRLLLCTDGLTNMVSDEEIGKCLEMSQPFDSVNCLVEKALANGGKDNISALVIFEPVKEEADENSH